MTEQIANLASSLGGIEVDESLRTLCRTAQDELTQRLRPGLTPADCGETFPLAAAWLVLAGMEISRDDGVSSFTAGDVSVRKNETAHRQRVLRLMAETAMRSFLKDEGFGFWGVKG